MSLKVNCKTVVLEYAKLMGLSGMLLILLERYSAGKNCCQHVWEGLGLLNLLHHFEQDDGQVSSM